MKHTLLCIAFLLMMSPFISAQNPTDFFKDYGKLSFQFGPSKYVGSKTSELPNTLRYKFRDYIAPQFGFYYDVYQTNHFNFKIGLTALLTREIEEFYVNSDELPNFNGDIFFTTETSSDGMFRFNLPLSTEYIVNTSFSKLSFNLGFIIGYQREYGVTESGFEFGASPEAIPTTLESVYSRSNSPWYFNTQFGLGMYFPFNKWMLRTNVFYNLALQDLYTGTFRFTNLDQSPDINGNFNFRGHSFGIEFGIYLAKKSTKQL
jgi:hypothetical protein